MPNLAVPQQEAAVQAQGFAQCNLTPEEAFPGPPFGRPGSADTESALRREHELRMEYQMNMNMNFVSQKFNQLSAHVETVSKERDVALAQLAARSQAGSSSKGSVIGKLGVSSPHVDEAVTGALPPRNSKPGHAPSQSSVISSRAAAALQEVERVKSESDRIKSENDALRLKYDTQVKENQELRSIVPDPSRVPSALHE